MNNIEFISAGAGSGKTYRLTVTLSDALESGSARPHAILATTFTVKAATELRERARSWLLEKGRIDLATAVGQARLGTVNSVCGQMLKRFCFELGLSPDQTVLSEGQSKRLLASSLAEALDEAGQSDLVALTARFGIEQSEWSKSIEAIVKAARDNGLSAAQLRPMGARNADLMLANWPAPIVGADPTAELSQALTTAVNSVVQFMHVSEAAGREPTKVLRDGALELQRLDRAFRGQYWTWPDWIAACRINAGAKVADLVQPVAEAGQSHEAHPLFHAEVRRYLDLVFNLAANALQTYAQAKLEIGGVDFGDQEVLLLTAVRENQTVREALASELDLVMVDEFQDTSPLQLALFVEFAKLAKRSVWVGDPKQAIYGFRGTDARLISGVLGAIKAWGGTLGDPLTTSRRSTPALVSLTNAVFESSFLPEMSPEDVRLTPSRQDIPDQPALINWNFESSKNETDYLGLGQAVKELINSGIQVEDKVTKQRRPVRPGDVAVLCRMNTQVDLAVTSLTQWGIPSASPRAGLLGTPEVIYVIACLRRLLDPKDTVASALILSFADGMAVEEWLNDRLNYLDSEGAMAHAWKIGGDTPHPLLARLEQRRPMLLALTPAEALRLAKAESQVASVSSRWSQSPHEAKTRISNVEALLDLAGVYEDECAAAKRPATVSGLLRWLNALAAEGADDRAVTAGDAVSVMTHHGAKGLEWPVVILTSLGTEAKSSLWGVRARTDGDFNPERPLDNRFIHFWLKTWGKRSAPQSAANAEDSDIGKAMGMEALAENKRLLYVSLTRARDVNVLVSNIRKEAKRAWVDEIGASKWLFGDSGPLNLPDGRTLQRKSQTWSTADCGLRAPEQTQTICHWFDSNAPLSPQSLWFSPSSAKSGSFQVSASEPVGTRVIVQAKVDMTNLGTALHHSIARAAVKGEACDEEIERILRAWNVIHTVDQTAVKSQLEAFQTWLKRRWPHSSIHVEVPIEATRPDGSRLRGRIDLLVETPEGWILIDHKSNPGGSSRDDQLAQEYGPQLAEYAQAITLTSGKPVNEQWLYLPVAGRAIQVRQCA